MKYFVIIVLIGLSFLYQFCRSPGKEIFNEFTINSQFLTSVEHSFNTHDVTGMEIAIERLADSSLSDTIFFDYLMGLAEIFGFNYGIFDLTPDNKSTWPVKYNLEQRKIIRMNIVLVYRQYLTSTCINRHQDANDLLFIQDSLWVVNRILNKEDLAWLEKTFGILCH